MPNEFKDVWVIGRRVSATPEAVADKDCSRSGFESLIEQHLNRRSEAHFHQTSLQGTDLVVSAQKGAR